MFSSWYHQSCLRLWESKAVSEVVEEPRAAATEVKAPQVVEELTAAAKEVKAPQVVEVWVKGASVVRLFHSMHSVAH
jgi:hypothetical protein